MKIDLFLEKIEIGFQSLIGFSIVGLLGMLLGIFFFSLLLYIISYEKKDKKISNLPVNGLSDIGDPVEANINGLVIKKAAKKETFKYVRNVS